MGNEIVVRPARPDDAAVWLEQRRALWPEGTEEEHGEEIAQFFAGRFPRGPWAVLLAESAGEVVGFVELSIRPYAEGCCTSRVAYLEGWYVLPEARRCGIGRALVVAAEDWGRTQGCTEFASDVEPTNETSSAAHLALGFTDAGLVRCFKKELR